MKDLHFELFSRYRGALMGIAILGVCILHGFAWAGVDKTIFAKALQPFARIAFTEGFLFLSGFGLYYSIRNGTGSFLVKRINRVLFPYIIMTAPFFLYNFFIGDSSLAKILLQVSTLYFWFFGNDGMWYISISMVLYFLFPFIYKFTFGGKPCEYEVGIKVFLLITVCILFCYGLYIFVPNYYKQLEIGISKIPIFLIGMLVGYYSFNKKTISLRHIIGGGFLLSITYLLKNYSDFFSPYYEIAYKLLMMPLACIVLMIINNKRLELILQWFGKYSLEIYILQMLMIGTMDRILKGIGFQSEYYCIWQTVLTFSFVVIICAPVHKGIDKIVNIKL